ncbi:MAG: biotin--[acetyl-CoA-carboxylase] ligase [Alphaproteobacteria bacterium]|nr:biotin--[acetyl-CoA-carboxylase] ligase [Alphaproteobacteria bacterium]
MQSINIVELDTVGSTNDHARQLAEEGAASGTVVWAHKQTVGRGRQGNLWVGSVGNLFMSMILRPHTDGEHIGQLSFLSAVALANVLETLLPETAKITLKWPNDLLINRKKAAGILIETESCGTNPPWVVIGIGVNIIDAPEKAISLYDVGVKDCEPGDVLQLIAREIMLLAEQWEQDGFDPIREAWLMRSCKQGEPLTARLPKETLTGTFGGLDHTGALLLTLPNKQRKVITSGEVFE